MNDTKISEAAKFMKRQVVIEAMRFDGSIASASAICHWANAGDEAAGHDDATVSYITRGGDDSAHDMVIWTLEGDMTASAGDWIIKGVKGEFYPCKPDIFEMTYTSHLHPQPAELVEQQGVWPFVESPGEFTVRLREAIDSFHHSNLLGAVRHVLIENPPTLAATGKQQVAPWRDNDAAIEAKALATATEIALMWGQDRSQFVSRIQVAVIDAMRWMGAAALAENGKQPRCDACAGDGEVFASDLGHGVDCHICDGTGKQQVGENPAWRDELVREAHSRGLMEGLDSPRPQQVGEVQGDARAQFEAWATSRRYSILRHTHQPEQYMVEEVGYMWRAWRAALAARQPVRIYGCCAQPEGELHTAECPNMRHLAARQPGAVE